MPAYALNSNDMKKTITMALTAMLALSLNAKDIKVVRLTTTPPMHCEGCETRIKENLRFEKGIKKIETDRATQTVTVTYDADKNSEAAIIEAFTKFGYKAEKKE